MAAGLGALHALEPGHGKTMMAVFLAGSRGTVGNAVSMGLVVTITHTSLVLLLAGLTVAAAGVLPMEEIQHGLGIAAAGMLVAMGLWLIWSRGRQVSGHAPHGHHGGPDHHHDHGHTHGHDHPHGESGMRAGEVLTMGVSAGMVPCPGAMAVYLLGLSTGQYLLGLVTVGAFSVGLAATLVVLGVAVVWARDRWLPQAAAESRFARFAPLATAIIVTLLGCVLLFRAIRIPPVDHETLPSTTLNAMHPHGILRAGRHGS